MCYHDGMTKKECLVKQSPYGRCGGFGKADASGRSYGTFLPAGMATATSRYARTETRFFLLADLHKCECGCAGLFVIDSGTDLNVKQGK